MRKIIALLTVLLIFGLMFGCIGDTNVTGTGDESNGTNVTGTTSGTTTGTTSGTTSGASTDEIPMPPALPE